MQAVCSKVARLPYAVGALLPAVEPYHYKLLAPHQFIVRCPCPCPSLMSQPLLKRASDSTILEN